jgi:hypothetical protein
MACVISALSAGSFIDAGVVNIREIADTNAIRVAPKQVVAENQNY